MSNIINNKYKLTLYNSLAKEIGTIIISAKNLTEAVETVKAHVELENANSYKIEFLPFRFTVTSDFKSAVYGTVYIIRNGNGEIIECSDEETARTICKILNNSLDTQGV